MKNILIVEDNKDICAVLQECLEGEGYRVSTAYTGIDGLREIKENTYDLVLLDIMLPYKSGDEVLKEMRKTSQVPVIVISAKDMVGTKIDLLKLGADDYITKPFDLGEVLARIESTLRRVGVNQTSKVEEAALTYKDMALNTVEKSVKVNEHTLDLTGKEYMILELMMNHTGKVFTKANLYESVWHEEYIEGDNTVKTHISNLRNKIKKVGKYEEYIETVWGLGYRLVKE